MGYTILPPENLINEFAYYLAQSQPQKAEALFLMNTKNYPKSANAFDSMGDFYAGQKTKAKAIENIIPKQWR